jgi:hypothetical protein
VFDRLGGLDGKGDDPRSDCCGCEDGGSWRRAGIGLLSAVTHSITRADRDEARPLGRIAAGLHEIEKVTEAR